jgi:Ankyrin repeat
LLVTKKQQQQQKEFFACIKDRTMTESRIKEFVQQGGDFDCIYETRTPLMHALHIEEYGMAKLLLQNGANVNAKNDNGDGKYVIHYAQTKEAVELLALYGVANLDAKDSKGHTLLCCALHKSWYDDGGSGMLETAIALLENGTNPSNVVHDERMQTLLHVVVKLALDVREDLGTEYCDDVMKLFFLCLDKGGVDLLAAKDCNEKTAYDYVLDATLTDHHSDRLHIHESLKGAIIKKMFEQQSQELETMRQQHNEKMQEQDNKIQEQNKKIQDLTDLVQQLVVVTQDGVASEKKNNNG